MNSDLSFIGTLISLTLITLGGLHAIFLSYNSRFGKNYRFIDTWISGMDITAHGQRFQGARCKKHFEFYASKDGLFGAVTKRLYSTISGRYFEIEVTSMLCEVTNWKVTLVPADDAAIFLSTVHEDAAPVTPQ